MLQFDKIGKATKDLFGKKYDFNGLAVKTTNKSSDVTFESAGNFGASVSGYTKMEWADANMKAVVQLSTSDKDRDTNAELTMKGLAKGLDVTLSSNAVPDVTLKTTYTHAQFASTCALSRDMGSNATTMNMMATAGQDAFVLGGSMCMDLSNGAPDLKNHNLGLQYNHKDFTASMHVKDQMNKLSIGYFHKNFSNMKGGLQMGYNMKDGSTSMSAAMQREIDSNTTLKAKACMNGGFCTVLEHRLSNPNMAFGLASKFDVSTGRLVSKGFGLNLAFSS